MSEPSYGSSYFTNSCDSLTIQERIKLMTSIPSFLPSRSGRSELFERSEFMEQRDLLEQQKLLEQQALLQQHELMNQRELEQRQERLDQSAATQKKCIISGLLDEIRGKKYNGLTRAPSITIVRPKPIHPAVEKWFRAMDTKHEGRISSRELQQAFEIFQGKLFSDAACKFVVRIFDLDKNGGLDIKEFETLYYHIKLWVNAFNTYDRDNSGFLDETELDYALRHLDIHFSSDFINFLITRTDSKARKISLDQYIITCIQIQKFTDEFKSRDPNYTGNINIKYEDFLEMILRCL